MPCLNKVRSHDCYGPYLPTSCAHCQTFEGEKCLAPKAKLGCKGPLYGGACGYCKGQKLAVTAEHLQEFQDDRRARGPWLTSLNLPSVRLTRFLDANTTYTPAQVDQKYKDCMANGLAVRLPWVKAGNLYMTVTTGNDTGWRELVQMELMAEGRRNFSVFTGRHGVINGSLTQDGNSDLFSDKVPDPKHLREDIIQKAVLDSQFYALPRPQRPVVRLYDVGTTQGSTMTRTQQLAMARMSMGDTVIFAWCWSLLSVYKAPVTAAEARKKEYDPSLAYNRPIRDILQDKYGWVDKLALGDMYSDDYMRWRQRVGWREDEARNANKALRRVGVNGQQAAHDEVAKHVHDH